VASAFAEATHVTKLSLRNTRVVVAAMEPRAGLCSYDKASGKCSSTVRIATKPEATRYEAGSSSDVRSTSRVSKT